MFVKIIIAVLRKSFLPDKLCKEEKIFTIKLESINFEMRLKIRQMIGKVSRFFLRRFRVLIACSRIRSVRLIKFSNTLLFQDQLIENEQKQNGYVQRIINAPKTLDSGEKERSIGSDVAILY